MKQVYCPPETTLIRVQLESPICTNYSKTKMENADNVDVSIEEQDVVDFTDLGWD